MSVPLVISLPDGLNVSGVSAWAVRLANARASLGHPVALVVHPTPPGQRALPLRLHPAVMRFDTAAGLPRLAECGGDVRPYLPIYAEAVRRLGARGPVVLSPNLQGDAYAIAAALATAEADRVRVVSWLHSDNAYDVRVAAHFEPMLSAFVPVSRRLEAEARRIPPARADDITRIPYGVPVLHQPPRRREPDAALRLLYAGRLEHRQKRILALVRMSDELHARGVSHRLTIMGDGPAAADLDLEARRRPDRIRRLPPGPMDEVDDQFDRHDLVVLASRFEGLSVAMLEAMGRGIPCVVTRVESGADEAIRDGIDGITEPAGDSDDDAGLALARGVVRASEIGVSRLGLAAWETARERYSTEMHARHVDRLLARCVESPARPWPTMRPCAYSAEGSGSVPADAQARLARVLGSLAGERIVIHGCGAHTRALGATLARSPATILAITDDDRAAWGSRLWGWEVIAPQRAGELGARHVILSSFLHEAAIFARRDAYERQGLSVHRLYA